MKTKDAIFLSHSASDSLAANALADYLHDVFDCRVFLSEEIETGEKWRDAILSALNDCRAVVVLATPNSIDRIWVNFEIGAAHALAKPVLPICAGGLAIDSLPDTLNDRQAAMLENDEDCRRILQTLRSHLGRRANLMKVGRKLPQFEIVAHPKNGFKAMPRRDESFAQAASEILAAACRDKTELRVAGVANTIFFGAQARLSRELHNALRDGMKARFIFLDPQSMAATRRGIWEFAKLGTKTVIEGCIRTARDLQSKYPEAVQLRVAQEMPIFLCMNDHKMMLHHPYFASATGQQTHAFIENEANFTYENASEHFEKLWGNRWVLLDIGNVLVTFNHRRVASGLAKFLRRPQPQIQTAVHKFIFDETGGPSRNSLIDCGKLSIESLREEFCGKFKAKVSQVQFNEVWCSIFAAPSPDAADCIRRLRNSGIKVGICSNANEVHWAHLVRVCPELEHPEVVKFLSFQLRRIKTDPGFFLEIACRTGRPYEEHLLVDDLQSNIQAADAVGMKTMQAPSPIHFEEIAEYARSHYWLWT